MEQSQRLRGVTHGYALNSEPVQIVAEALVRAVVGCLGEVKSTVVSVILKESVWCDLNGAGVVTHFVVGVVQTVAPTWRLYFSNRTVHLSCAPLVLVRSTHVTFVLTAVVPGATLLTESWTGCVDLEGLIVIDEVLTRRQVGGVGGYRGAQSETLGGAAVLVGSMVRHIHRRGVVVSGEVFVDFEDQTKGQTPNARDHEAYSPRSREANTVTRHFR